MIALSDEGVKYFSATSNRWKFATRGQDIVQADYDALPPWERYCVLSHFVSEGDEPVRVRYENE